MPFSRSQPCHSHQLEPCNYFPSAAHALPSASAPQTAPEPLPAAGKRKIHDEAATESITIDINMRSSGQVVVERTERGIPHKFLLYVKTLSDRMIPMAQSYIILSTLLKTKQNKTEGKNQDQTLSSLMRALHCKKYQYGVFLGPRRGFLSGSSSPSS